MVSSFPFGGIIHNQEVFGRITKWSVELMDETLTYAPREAIKSQILADFIADWTDTQLPMVQIQAYCWAMYFDWSVMKKAREKASFSYLPSGTTCAMLYD